MIAFSKVLSSRDRHREGRLETEVELDHSLPILVVDELDSTQVEGEPLKTTRGDLFCVGFLGVPNTIGVRILTVRSTDGCKDLSHAMCAPEVVNCMVSVNVSQWKLPFAGEVTLTLQLLDGEELVFEASLGNVRVVSVCKPSQVPRIYWIAPCNNNEGDNIEIIIRGVFPEVPSIYFGKVKAHVTYQTLDVIKVRLPPQDNVGAVDVTYNGENDTSSIDTTFTYRRLTEAA
jgi:hypothetical protein